jgi:hypothetical protein
MRYVCCALLLLSSSILHIIPRHQQSPMPSFAGTCWHQHCPASNPECYYHISTISTATTIVPTTPCPPAQSRLPPAAAACHLLACDVMQCFVRTSNPWLVFVVVNGIATHLLVLLLLLACGSIGCFFVSVVQYVSNISCRDVLCMLCFVAAVVFYPPLHPMPSTITDAFFCWHLLAPAPMPSADTHVLAI